MVTWNLLKTMNIVKTLFVRHSRNLGQLHFITHTNVCRVAMKPPELFHCTT